MSIKIKQQFKISKIVRKVTVEAKRISPNATLPGAGRGGGAVGSFVGGDVIAEIRNIVFNNEV